MKMQKTKGTLYICPTPIGNLEDITLRALRVLREVDMIACEDTRVTQKLLNHYEIRTKLVSCHKFSEKQKSNYLINLLNEGNSIALVSDAGTPLINDPGTELLNRAIADNIRIIPLPGACSITTALSASPQRDSCFVFIGFLPRTNKEILLKYKNIDIVAFESPNRLLKSLEDIHKTLGNRTITVARELTKIYEELKTDNIAGLIEYYSQNPLKGEIVLVIYGEKQLFAPDNTDLEEKISALRKEGYSAKDVSKILSVLYKYPKNKIYDFIVSLTE